jgi:threonine dehydrogenase-like Zn-dependent dehydrogenase
MAAEKIWAQRLEAPERFVRCEIDAPNPDLLADDQVLLQTTAGGICGSDLPLYRGKISPPGSWATSEGFGKPGFPMHEVVGRVLASRHPDHRPGDRVVGWASGCDAIAEQVVSHGDLLVGYNPDLAPEVAVLLQPLACVLYAVEQLPDPSGVHVAVLGLGPIGLLFCHVLHNAGAGRITGVDRVDRTALSDAFGINEVVHSSTDRWVAGLREADRPLFAIEAVGHQGATVNDSIHAAAEGGRVLCFGIPDDSLHALDLVAMLRKNLTVYAGVTREHSRVLAAANTYLANHPDLTRSYVTDVVEAKRVGEAFDRGCRPRAGQVKVTITME